MFFLQMKLKLRKEPVMSESVEHSKISLRQHFFLFLCSLKLDLKVKYTGTELLDPFVHFWIYFVY